MPFFDSHCHFDFARFDEDRMQVWQRALALGVKGLLIPGVEPAQWPVAHKLSHELPDCYFAVGIHPWWIGKLATDPLALQFYAFQMSRLMDEERISGRMRCVAIGETGLDKNIATPMAQQRDLLDWHIELANQFQRPLIVHSVKAHNELIAQCKKRKPLYGGVVHGFSGSYETAMQYINMGFYIGAGGTISYARAQKTRTAFARIPLEFVLLETDAPDMPLNGQQGQRNSPENIPRIAQFLAGLRGETVETIATVVWENNRRLFGVA